MTAVLITIDWINNLLEKLNKGAEPALRLYRLIEGMFKGTPDAFPELPDEAVILLFKQRADRGVNWVNEELARIDAIPPTPPQAPGVPQTLAERRAAAREQE
jgi:hypothetical protein